MDLSLVISLAALAVSCVSIWISVVRDREDRHIRMITRRSQAMAGIIKHRGLLSQVHHQLQTTRLETSDERDRLKTLLGRIEAQHREIQDVYEKLKGRDITTALPDYTTRIALEDIYCRCDVVLEKVNLLAATAERTVASGKLD